MTPGSSRPENRWFWRPTVRRQGLRVEARRPRSSQPVICYVVNGLGFGDAPGIGGADKRVVEIGRRLPGLGVGCALLTTDTGRRVLAEAGLECEAQVLGRPGWWPLARGRSVWARGLEYLYVTLAAAWLARRAPRADTFHASSDMFFDVIPGLAAARRRGARFTAMIHHLNPLSWSPSPTGLAASLFNWLGQWVGHLLIAACAANILVYASEEGQRVRRRLRRLGVPEGRIVPVHNGVDTQRIASAKPAAQGYDGCYVGSLRPQKGLEELLEIWRRVADARPDARLGVVGAGAEAYEASLRAKSEQSGLARNVEFLGAQTPDEVAGILRASRVFVFPSHWEGWGIAVCEAMAAGLPVVAYDLPTYEIFGEALLRVPVGDVTGAAQRVLGLMSDSDSYARAAGRARAAAEAFDWRHAVEVEARALLARREDAPGDEGSGWSVR